MTPLPNIEDAKRNGFTFLRNLFASDLARQAHDELTHWYEIDEADRAKRRPRKRITWARPVLPSKRPLRI